MERTSQPPSPPDESDRSTADEQIRPTGSSQARSYECIFCKRGFSTAQALGGHMNIHRKDKAKLKQLAATSATSPNPNTEAQLSLNQQSVDIPRSPSLFYSPNINLPSSQTHESLYSMSTKIDNPDKGKFSTWPRFRRGDSPAGFDVDHLKGRELPAVFFEDEIPASKEQELDDDRFPLPDDEDKGDDHPPPIHGDPGSAEIDLELRLGPERPQASSSPSKVNAVGR